MGRTNTSVEKLLAEWDEGNLSRGSLAWLLLCCANFYHPDHLLDSIPIEHRGEFVRELSEFPAGGGGFVAGDRLEAPSDQAITQLKEALARRPGYVAGP